MRKTFKLKFSKYEVVIDFFVHPEFKKEDYLDNESYESYENCLVSILEASELPILITNGKDELFAKKLKTKENILDSIGPSSHDSVVGEVNKYSWERLDKLVRDKKSSEMIIHGAFFGECTEGFALQLFVYLTTGKYWDGSQNRIFNENLLKYHEANGDFLRSNIKYGTVLKNGKIIDIIKPTIAPFRVRDSGNLTHQLIGYDTVIHALH